MVIGLFVSIAILLVVGRTSDALVEITLTTIAAYGSFLGCSTLPRFRELVSALSAGLMIGSLGQRALSDEGRDRVDHAWEFFAFLANSVIFILIGMNVADQPLSALGSAAAAVAIILVVASRGLSIYPLSALFHMSQWRLPPSYQHILFGED